MLIVNKVIFVAINCLTSLTIILDNNFQLLDYVEYSKSYNNIEKFRFNQQTHENLQFPNDTETISKDFDVETIDLNTNKTREDQQIGLLSGITKIDMGIQSQLLVSPGMTSQLYFEVTNLRQDPIFHTIQVVDDQRFLRALNPQSILLRGGETTTVVVSVMVPTVAQQGTIDKITLTCQGQGQTSQSVNLKVMSKEDTQDRTPPYLTWTFGTRCDGYYYNQGQCTARYWSLDIYAQDYETGILRLSSTPIGIVSPTPFTVGSTDAVRATYTASCCQPRVTISAYDLAGNQRTYTIDVRDLVLTEASIAAVVLGVILLILLIGLLIGLIVWCCKKRKSQSRDLPSYRSHPERTRT